MFSKLLEAISKDLSELTTEMKTEKETSTVHTVESLSDDDISECDSLETIELLQLDDDDDQTEGDS